MPKPPQRTWEVQFGPKADAWFQTLNARQRYELGQSIDRVRAVGPTLGRPWVDHIKGSRHGNLKEVRTKRGTLRMLFAFDPSQTAVMLVGGDKQGAGERWYRKMIKIADAELDQHLMNGQREGRWRAGARVVGRASEPRSR